MTEVSVPLLRLERGSLDAEELAALTAVLHTRAAALACEPTGMSCKGRAVARWRRLERTFGFDGPRTWRGAVREPF
ncbi:acyl-CoA carboxylase subunit epsilon [Kitasatospora sp. MAA4]|uniref:acyl-CoA carboxylase subunit epsilon n=1 Tax=Kitasatospora sp. MAA4 TaxID=3035093 RepID=UPI002474A372|nr:acyl-CoA carboxylase subunit epsilon [Kitasatospora sp. MAA4]